MVKKHLKRLTIKKSWNIAKKEHTFTTRPNPGSHSAEMSIPLATVFRDYLHYAHDKSEAKRILCTKEVLVDGKRRKDQKFPVGLFDVIEIKDSNEYFRFILLKDGKLALIKISKEEANLKPCKIVNKGKVKGKTQLNLYDGKNILVEKDDYSTNDTILLDISKKEIKSNIKFEKGKLIFLIGGKHIGAVGKIEDVSGKKIIYKIKDNNFETLKKYTFVIGEDKPIINLQEK